jgi:hypothetical protein
MATKLLLRLNDETEKELKIIKKELEIKTSSKTIQYLIENYINNKKSNELTQQTNFDLYEKISKFEDFKTILKNFVKE